MRAIHVVDDSGYKKSSKRSPEMSGAKCNIAVRRPSSYRTYQDESDQMEDVGLYAPS